MSQEIQKNEHMEKSRLQALPPELKLQLAQCLDNLSAGRIALAGMNKIFSFLTLEAVQSIRHDRVFHSIFNPGVSFADFQANTKPKCDALGGDILMKDILLLGLDIETLYDARIRLGREVGQPLHIYLYVVTSDGKLGQFSCDERFCGLLRKHEFIPGGFHLSEFNIQLHTDCASQHSVTTADVLRIGSRRTCVIGFRHNQMLKHISLTQTIEKIWTGLQGEQPVIRLRCRFPWDHVTLDIDVYGCFEPEREDLALCPVADLFRELKRRVKG